MTDRIEWTKRERAHGDPHWVASFGPYALTVTVGCPWIWTWEIDHPDHGEEARSDDDWDYQEVAKAQQRCELMARALLIGADTDIGAAVPDDFGASLQLSLLRGGVENTRASMALGGKALRAASDGDTEKALHHDVLAGPGPGRTSPSRRTSTRRRGARCAATWRAGSTAERLIRPTCGQSRNASW